MSSPNVVLGGGTPSTIICYMFTCLTIFYISHHTQLVRQIERLSASATGIQAMYSSPIIYAALDFGCLIGHFFHCAQDNCCVSVSIVESSSIHHWAHGSANDFIQSQEYALAFETPRSLRDGW
jgi:hypothetical protein